MPPKSGIFEGVLYIKKVKFWLADGAGLVSAPFGFSLPHYLLETLVLRVANVWEGPGDCGSLVALSAGPAHAHLPITVLAAKRSRIS